MNDYGFDYMNYISNVPSSMNYDYKNNPSYTTKNKFNIDMMNNDNQILEPYQGFVRGNLFANSYEPYKNYKPLEIDPTNEREALLYQLMQYKFALVELNLYLDTHPNDRSAISLYNKYLALEKQTCNKYESMYGPITLDSNYLGENNWNWKNSPWPWEVL